jgi:uncharacterized protein (TIGR02466 family)
VNEAGDNVQTTASELLFSTPIFRQVLPEAAELNEYLRELILFRERADAKTPQAYSNVGGWHSAIDLQASLDQGLRLVLQKCRELAMLATERLLTPAERSRAYRYLIAAWANVSREGNYNVPHVHMSTWSAVYYVSVPDCGGDEPMAGGLELLDPRPATAMVGMPGKFFATRHLIKPQPGLLVLFPASIVHFVHPFRGAGERISIACDLTLETV